MTTRPSDFINATTVPSARHGSRAAVEAVWRIEAARLIASLARLTGDLADAEDLAQDALVAALEQWPAHGIPANPGGWLMISAKNRLIDQIRRHKTMQRKLPHLHHERERQDQAAVAGRDARLDDQIGDELLGLILTACHPALSIESRVALTLRCLGGLSTDQIARAFLIGEPTAAQRIVRAKKTLREKGVAFELPSPEQIRERLPGVLQILYLIFNEGFAASSGTQWMRPSLCEEALRLARVLAGLLADLAEVQGFLALLELQTARIPAPDHRGRGSGADPRSEPPVVGPAADPARPGGNAPSRTARCGRLACRPVHAPGRYRRLPRPREASGGHRLEDDPRPLWRPTQLVAKPGR
jgi:RNA polymerase sigma factor (sigma-70 family)